MTEEKTPEEWEQVIADNVPYIDVRPYSHNIIGLALGAIAKKKGDDEAKRLIIKYRLDKKGWKV